MSRILVVELCIQDESGCPFGTKKETVSATLNTKIGSWSIRRVKLQENEKEGNGATRRLAVINWLHENNKAD